MTNVLPEVGEEQKLVTTWNENQKKWIGHVLRHDALLGDIVEGRTIMMLDGFKANDTTR